MDRKAKIITAAIEVFAQRGRHGARMEEIAARANVNKAMLYYYYTSKDVLFREVLKTIIRSTMDSITARVEEDADNDENPVEKVKGFVEAHYEAFSQNIDYARIVLSALSSEPEQCREAVETVRRDLTLTTPRKVRATFEEGISQNIFRNIDHRQILVSIIGANLIYFIAKPIAEILLNLEIEDEQRFLKEREETVVDLLLHGILKRLSAGE